MEGVISKNPSTSPGPEALLLIPHQQGGNRIQKSGKAKGAKGLARERNSEQKCTKKKKTTNKPGSLPSQCQGAAEVVLSLMQSKPSPKNPTTKVQRTAILPCSFFQQDWVFFRHRATQREVISLFLLCHLCFTPSSLFLFSASVFRKK